VIQFWWRSGSRFGSGSLKSEIRILGIGGGLCSLSASSFFCTTYANDWLRSTSLEMISVPQSSHYVYITCVCMCECVARSALTGDKWAAVSERNPEPIYITHTCFRLSLAHILGLHEHVACRMLLAVNATSL